MLLAPAFPIPFTPPSTPTYNIHTPTPCVLNTTGFWRLLTVREGRHQTFIPEPQSAASSSDEPPRSEFHSFDELDWQRWLVKIPLGGQPATTAEEPQAGAEGGSEGSSAKEPEGSAPFLEGPQAPPPDALMIVVQVRAWFSVVHVWGVWFGKVGRVVSAYG